MAIKSHMMFRDADTIAQIIGTQHLQNSQGPIFPKDLAPTVQVVKAEGGC